MEVFNKNQKEESSKDASQKQELLKLSEVSLILDNYDDIFSDFDPRTYTQRALSYDFLDEMKRATRDLPSGKIQLKFLVPYHLRNIPTESAVKKRLKDHFTRHHNEYHKEMKKIKIKGAIMAFLGVGLIFFATYLLSLDSSSYLIKFLEVLLEPAGWFTAWTGLEHAFSDLEEKGRNLSFYEKMANAEVTFISY